MLASDNCKTRRVVVDLSEWVGQPDKSSALQTGIYTLHLDIQNHYSFYSLSLFLTLVFDLGKLWTFDEHQQILVCIAATGHNSSDYIHVLVEAVRLAQTDGLCYLGDPAHTSIPLETLLDKSYSSQRAQLITMDRCVLMFACVCWYQCVPVDLC